MQRFISNPLQTIMSKVDALPIIKLRYFHCRKAGLHDGEVLNYVCIEKGCQEKGLICSVCKNDHSDHHVLPLKYFLNKLKQHKQNAMIQSQSFQKELEQLQLLKNSFLFDLKQAVQQLAQKVQQVEEHIIEKFKRQKVELLSQIEIKMRFNQIIEQAIKNDLSDQNSFERDFKLIAGSVQVKNNSNVENGSNANDIYFHANLDKIVTQYEHSYQSFNTNLIQFSLYSTNTLNDLMKEEQSVIQQGPKKREAEQLNHIKTEVHAFNNAEKGSNVKISENKKTVECIKGGNQRFALIDGVVHKKGSSIRFKVQKLKNWVGLGLAVRDIIKGKKFQFQYTNLGHGSYLLSNNSYMWSHTSAAHNIKNSEFTFSEGQIIKIEVTEKELVYTNETSKTDKKIPISLTEHEWTQACFCVNLCSVGDAATIL